MTIIRKSGRHDDRLIFSIAKRWLGRPSVYLNLLNNFICLQFFRNWADLRNLETLTVRYKIIICCFSRFFSSWGGCFSSGFLFYMNLFFLIITFDAVQRVTRFSHNDSSVLYDLSTSTSVSYHVHLTGGVGNFIENSRFWPPWICQSSSRPVSTCDSCGQRAKPPNNGFASCSLSTCYRCTFWDFLYIP